MTKWTNLMIRTDDPATTAKHIREMTDDTGHVRTDETTVMASVIDPINTDRLLQRISGYSTAAVVVTANDTGDSAGGRVYELGGDVEEVRAGYCDAGERRDWPGLHYNGLSMDGGKYY